MELSDMFHFPTELLLKKRYSVFTGQEAVGPQTQSGCCGEEEDL
jgi:hypothetical protein